MDTHLQALIASWHRSLRARNLAPKTLRTYRQSTDALVDWLATRKVTDPTAITRRHLEAFIAHLLETRSAATASVRYRALQQFFAWCEDEDEITPNPMAKMRPPVVPEKTVAVLNETQAKALLATCAGRDFRDRRDQAILRIFLDTGMRLAELTGLTLEDVDLDDAVLFVQQGKGRRGRAAPMGAATTAALDRYLRTRARHRKADLPAVWLGSNHRGPMKENGIFQMVAARGKEAGLDGLHPHALRHTWAHHARLAGMDDDSLMRLAGWRSRQMLHRYGASAADARALDTRRRVSMLGDKL